MVEVITFVLAQFSVMGKSQSQFDLNYDSLTSWDLIWLLWIQFEFMGFGIRFDLRNFAIRFEGGKFGAEIALRQMLRSSVF